VHTTARRIDGGQPLRDAMSDTGTSLKGLMRKTKAADAEGAGVSWQLLAFLATEKSYARETTTVRTAELIEDALSVPRGSLFSREDKYAQSDPQPAWDVL
jgi:ribosomal protein L11